MWRTEKAFLHVATITRRYDKSKTWTIVPLANAANNYSVDPWDAQGEDPIAGQLAKVYYKAGP